MSESFHVVLPAARLRCGYAEKTATLLGSKASLKFLPYAEWKTAITRKYARSTWDHIAHSPNCSIAKAQRLLCHQPRYTSMEAIADAMTAMRANGTLA